MSLALLAALASEALAVGGGWRASGPTSGTPTPRQGHSLTSASSTSIVLFGGATPAGSLLNETWVLEVPPACPGEAPTWVQTQIPPKTLWPSIRKGHVAVYDSHRNEVVVFGGQGPLGLLNDTWAFHVANRTWRKINASNPPCRRKDAAGVYDPNGQRLVVFGGTGAEMDYRDTWALDLQTATWSLVFPNGPQCDADCIGCTHPSARSNATAVYDAQTSSMILHGGIAGSTVLDDPWLLTLGSTPAWSPLTVVGGGPYPRSGHVVAFESSNGRIVYQGGRDTQGVTATAFIMTRVSGSTWQREDIVVGILPSAWEDHAGVWSSTDELWVLNCDNPPHQFGNLWAMSLDQTPPAQVNLTNELSWCEFCDLCLCWRRVQELCWDEVGDDGVMGPVCYYEVRWNHTGPVTDSNLGAWWGGPISPQGPPGSPLCVTVGTCDEPFHFPTVWIAVRAYDERGNWSPVSNNIMGGYAGCPDPTGASTTIPGDDSQSPQVASQSMDLRIGSQSPSRVEIHWVLGSTHAGRVFDLSVYDVAGRKIRRLAGGTAVAGEGKRIWDGHHTSAVQGRGVFFVRLTCGEESKAIPVVMIKR